MKKLIIIQTTLSQPTEEFDYILWPTLANAGATDYKGPTMQPWDGWKLETVDLAGQMVHFYQKESENCGSCVVLCFNNLFGPRLLVRDDADNRVRREYIRDFASHLLKCHKLATDDVLVIGHFGSPLFAQGCYPKKLARRVREFVHLKKDHKFPDVSFYQCIKAVVGVASPLQEDSNWKDDGLTWEQRYERLWSRGNDSNRQFII